MTITTPAASTKGTDASTLLINARRELDSISFRVPTAPLAVAATLTSLAALALRLVTTDPLADGTEEEKQTELRALIGLVEERAGSRPRPDRAYEHLLVLLRQTQQLLRWLEQAHGIEPPRIQAASAKRRNRATRHVVQPAPESGSAPSRHTVGSTAQMPTLGSAIALRQLTAKPSSARIQNCLRRGKDHYPVDIKMTEQLLAVAPFLRDAVAINDTFARRTVALLARQMGITQFIDLGCGLPTYPTLYETAVAALPRGRKIAVAYVDRDPIVIAHAATLLTAPRPHRTAHVHADLAQPDSILTDPNLLDALDLSRPVAVLAHAVLHELPQHAAYPAVSALASRLAPGSALSITHPTAALHPGMMKRVGDLYTESISPITLRSPHEVGRFFDGWRLLEPGLVETAHWHCVPGPAYPPGASTAFAAIAVKP
ncbi:SAM-dependent methyltransferase [Streptomyces sp. NPDC090499]|uniref:SAM-dependent methyltransferase n=1 Tax=Streptomyces sp. NPDC090499 TaxID=3365965 RepID=UPI003801D291